MSLTERKSEKTPDFVAVAEQAAMDKVMDIHNGFSLKHSFARFGHRDQLIDRLQGILINGIVAEKFAKKTRIPSGRNWADPVNKNGISLTKNSVWDAFGHAIMTVTRLEPTSKIQRENIYVILIEDYIAVKPRFRSTGEVLRENRISPRLFKGIVFMDHVIDEKDPFGSYGWNGVDYKTSSVEQTADIISQAILSVCKNPNLAIPVYGISGSLYWSRKMSYQEVQNFVGERRNNGI